MTVVVGVHLQDRVLIAADTRRVDATGRIVTDERCKVHVTESGLVAGAGLASLLDEVVAALATMPIQHTDEIRHVIAGAVQRARKDYEPGFGARVDQWIATTSILFSYESQDGLRLAYVNADRVHEMLHVHLGSLFVLSPSDASRDDVETINSCGEDRMQAWADGTSPIETPPEIIAETIKAYSRAAGSVGPSFHLGIHGTAEVPIVFGPIA